jgi:ABC-type oligopeptide transport system substrate-binding subunit
MKTVLQLRDRKFFSGLCLAVSALAMLSLFAGSAHAKAKKKPPAEVQKTIIDSVTPTAVTIKEGTVTKTLTISSVTEVTVNGQKATIADLKPGMVVSVTLRDPTNAGRIAATSQ